MVARDIELSVIGCVRPGKIYSTSILKVARHFWTVSRELLVRDLATEFRKRPDIPVVAVLDSTGRALGIIQAEQLFSLLGKPFGLEIIGKSPVEDILEDCPRWQAQAELFRVASLALTGADGDQGKWFLLESESGAFSGTFSSQDLFTYLSGITQQDVESAGRLQERLIAGRETLAGKGWRFDAWSRSAKGIGGDLYFSRKVTEEKAFFCLCDISGKGVSASVLVSMIWGMLRMYNFEKDMAPLIRELNSAVVEAFQLEKYLTGFFLSWDSSKRKLISADMGHSHILIFRNGVPGHIRSSKTNLPIGLEPSLEPVFNTWSLKSGDVVFVYSDGFLEQENSLGAEFGERRLCEVLTRCQKEGRSLAEGLPESFDRFRGSVPQQDDATFIALYVE
jgi:phosphoserine phosphatase RsbU/P